MKATAGDGGSGGGQGEVCPAMAAGGSGGTGGSDGGEASHDCSILDCDPEFGTAGQGQGNISSSSSQYFDSIFLHFIRNNFTAGSGGMYSKNVRGGGGGGGVLLNGMGPTAEDGSGVEYSGGRGGRGYGAGGGAGTQEYFLNLSVAYDRYYFKVVNGKGGQGANGLVYIEW